MIVTGETALTKESPRSYYAVQLETPVSFSDY